jgi:hypothetical protein
MSVLSRFVRLPLSFLGWGPKLWMAWKGSFAAVEDLDAADRAATNNDIL